MLRLRKPLLLEWRWWPAVMLAVLFLSAIWGAQLPSPPLKPQQDSPKQQTKPPPPDSGFPWESFWVFCTFGATGVLAVYAGRQFLDTRRSNERQLRAYVLVEKARVDGVEVEGRPNTMITFKNFGQTPAYRVRQWSQMGVELWAEGKVFPMEDGAKILPETQIGPGGQHRIRAKISDEFPAMSAEHFAALQNGEGAVFVIGRLHYEDIFGGKHTTEYVMFHGGPAQHYPNEMSPYEGRMKAT